MAGWKSRLQPASFRGVPFSVESDEGTFGRRVQTHEYPNRDKPYTEDLGRATRRFTISAYLIGDDYIDQRDRLIAAVDTPGPGTLVHPNYGEMAICVDGEVRVSHSNNEGRMCRISFSFVEAGNFRFRLQAWRQGKCWSRHVRPLTTVLATLSPVLAWRTVGFYSK